MLLDVAFDYLSVQSIETIASDTLPKDLECRDDRLRQPVFLGLRKDTNAAEVVREKANDEPSGRKSGSQDMAL